VSVKNICKIFFFRLEIVKKLVYIVNKHGQFAKKRKETGKMTEEKVIAKGFKGFDHEMKCRGKQYAENTVFEEEKAEMCKSGMHFCENPLDVLNYYPLLNDENKFNEFAPVEALAETNKENDKSVTTKLKVGAKLGLSGFIKAAVEFSLEWLKKVDFDKETASGDASQLASSGFNSKLASSGNYSKLASSGDDSKLASSGNYSQLASSGNYSKLASSGFNSKLASSGNYSQLASSGNYSSLEANGEDSIVAATGANCKVKGALGCFIACAEWSEDESFNIKPVAFMAAKVDGKIIKADTWYTVRDGKFVEVEGE
jgi:hypothetical protein